jgi:hypothetical protein
LIHQRATSDTGKKITDKLPELVDQHRKDKVEAETTKEPRKPVAEILPMGRVDLDTVTTQVHRRCPLTWAFTCWSG